MEGCVAIGTRDSDQLTGLHEFTSSDDGMCIIASSVSVDDDFGESLQRLEVFLDLVPRM